MMLDYMVGGGHAYSNYSGDCITSMVSPLTLRMIIRACRFYCSCWIEDWRDVDGAGGDGIGG